MHDYVTRRYLGSADCGPVLAYYRPELSTLAKYVNASDVWLRVVHGIKQPGNARMTRGLDWEPQGRALYRDSIGECTEAPGLQIHPAHPWACGSPDGFSGAKGIVELKTTTVFARNSWGEPGTDRVPDSYNTQMQWLMECSGRDWCHLLVAFGVDGKDEAGLPTFTVNETAVYQARRDAALCAELFEAADTFWRTCVLVRKSPDIAPLHNKRAWKRLVSDGRRDGEVFNSEVECGPVEGTGSHQGSHQGQD